MSRIHLGIAMAVLLGAFALVATAKDSPTSEMQQVETFTAVSFGLPGELTLVQTAEPMVSIDATPEQLEDIVVTVKDDVLILKKRRTSGWGPDLDDVRVQVGYQSLEAVRVAGSGSVLADAVVSDEFALAVSGSGEMLIQALECGDASISVAGSGDVTINRLLAQTLSTKISGSGDIELAGETGEQSLSIAGSGDYQAVELKSTVATLKIAGSGTARMNVRDRISGSVAGSGDLFYRGEPEVSVRVAGSGNVSRVEGAL